MLCMNETMALIEGECCVTFANDNPVYNEWFLPFGQHALNIISCHTPQLEQ